MKRLSTLFGRVLMGAAAVFGLGQPLTVHAQDGAFAAAAVTGNIHEMVTLPQAPPLAAAA